MTKSPMFRDVVSKMMEAVTLGSNGELKVLDESAMAEADKLLNTLVIEKARGWWDQLESAESDLAGMEDEINFADLEADPSHAPINPVDMDDEFGDDMDVAKTLESAFGSKEFDLDSIFEDFDDEDDTGPVDGDDAYDDLMRGDDEDGLGDEGPVGDDMDMDDEDDLDAIGGTVDPDMGDDGGDFGMGGDEEFNFDFLAKDTLGTDDMAGDLGGDLGDDDLGGDELGDDFGDEGMDDDMTGDFGDDEDAIGDEEDEYSELDGEDK